MRDGFYSRLYAFVRRRRWWILIAYAAITAALAWSASRIRLQAEITDLLPVGTRSADDLRFYLERFGTADTLFVTVSGPPGADVDALEQAAARLARRLEETGLFRAIRYGFSEDEAIALARRAMAHLPVLIPDDRAAALRAKVTPEAIEASLATLKRDAAGMLMIGPRETLAAEDPLGLASLLPSPGGGGALPVAVDPGTGLFLSPDGRTLLLLTTPLAPPQDIDFSKKLLSQVERIERELAPELDGLTLDHAGGYLFAVQDEARIRHDITATATLSMAAITILFALVLRRLGLLLILMVPLTLSTLWTLGVAAVYPGHLNVVTVAFAAILLGMGDDSLTHLYLRFREEIVSGADRDTSLGRALGSTGPSILVATLTSGLAFSALTFVDFRGLSELGIIAAIGMLNLLVSALLLFPALLSLGPRRPAKPLRPLVLPMGLFIRFHRWGRPRRRLVMLATFVVLAAAALACTRLQFTSDLKALRGADPAADRLERLLAPFGGAPDPIQVVFEANSPGAALEKAEKLEPLCDALREERLITGCSSVATWLPSPSAQRERFERLSTVSWRSVSRDLRATAERLDLNVSFFAPFLENLDHYGSWDAVRIEPDDAGETTPTAGGLSGNDVATAVFPVAGVAPARVLERARKLRPGLFGPDTHAASVGLVTGDLTRVIERDFQRASLLAFGAVALLALAAFRTIARTLLVGLPVMAGCLLMLGGLALLGVPINLMNLVATPLVFGLGIDFGVYIVNRHEEEARADVARVLNHTGGAILLTGLTTVAGFGSLLAAEFAGLRSMGWVAVLGIGGCLLSSLLILPLLLPEPPPEA